MPASETWAELRVQLVATLYSRCVEPARLDNVLFKRLPARDVVRLRHRLGILTVWDPRRPRGRYRLTLSNADERFVAKTLMSVSLGCNGGWADAFYAESETFATGDWTSLFDLPYGSWADPDPADLEDTKLPKKGTFVFTWGADDDGTGATFLDAVGAGRAPVEEPILRVG